MDKKGLKAANDGLIIDLSYLVLLWRSLFSYCQALLVSPNEALLIYSGLFSAPLKLKLSPNLWPLHLFFAQLNFFAMTKFFFLIEKKIEATLDRTSLHRRRNFGFLAAAPRLLIAQPLSRETENFPFIGDESGQLLSSTGGHKHC